MTLAQKVDRLWALHEIRQLAYDYAWGIDARDTELLRSLWAETDTPTELPEMDGHYVKSHDFDRWLGLGAVVLFVGNHRIHFEDDDHATGTVYCIVQMEEGETFIDQTILYQDRYVRQSGRWLFVARRHELWFGQARESNPFHQPPANWPEKTHGRGTLPESLPSFAAFRARFG